MDILTLELFDVTVSQALREVQGALERHPGLPVRILVDSDEMLRLNLERFLARQGRPAVARSLGTHWQLEVPKGADAGAPRPAPVIQPLLPPPADGKPRPTALLRSAFAPGDRALGRQLLLGVLDHLDARTPWLLLAHEALELLEDPRALAALRELEGRGVPVRVCRRSLEYLGPMECPFLPMEAAEWQTILGRGELILL